jgi:uncharacterized repeat protein (TIGR03803 family)
MRSTQVFRSRISALTMVAFVAFFVSVATAASTTHVLYSFLGDADGEYADTDLVTDSAGNIYGSTVQGGSYGGGTVFQVTPAGVHTVLYSFTGGTDGGEPYKGVTLDAQGNIYGTAGVGGKYVGPCTDTGCGVVFKLTNSGGTWNYSVIHSFTGGSDGWGPGAGVTVDSHAAVYGMTPLGGKSNAGVIYQLKRDASGTWREKIIHSFTGGNDGLGGSAGRLLPDGAGGFFGACTAGGANGDGVVFRISPGASGSWTLKPLYQFKGMPDAGFPYGSLLRDKSGNLYGTSYYDGANDLGAVYKLTNNGGSWSESVLYSFKGGSDGSGPISNLVFDSAGNLYGTASEGGSASCGCGTIFRLSPSGGTWKESTVHQFMGPPDGAFVYNGMVVDNLGNFYGATVHGGTANEGSIYKFIP